ncbi:MAG: hypothetical protein IPI93_06180 [Sphingobacteriaceae bacterium]|nr:hypothetical protein [Sphingobacteriaceae bacterium]
MKINFIYSYYFIKDPKDYSYVLFSSWFKTREIKIKTILDADLIIDKFETLNNSFCPLKQLTIENGQLINFIDSGGKKWELLSE